MRTILSITIDMSMLTIMLVLLAGQPALSITSLRIPAKTEMAKFPPGTPKDVQDLQCDSDELSVIKSEAQKRFSVIVSGQGGSSTRAAQEVVELAGTHAFGEIDAVTHDSLASREGEILGYRVDLLKTTGTVDYDPQNLPAELLEGVSEKLCKTLMIIHRQCEADNKPWALKEPWLRVFLPFFKSFNVKFIHVTRDIRNIHETHGDQVWHGPDGSEVRGWSDESYDWLELVHPVTGEALPSVPQKLEIAKDDPVDDISRYQKFARVWAVIELTLYERWTHSYPDRYFHISEHNMRTPEDAKKLAKFLGASSPSEDSLLKMSSVYLPLPDAPDEHYQMMQGIVQDPVNMIVRDALEAFGYEI